MDINENEIFENIKKLEISLKNSQQICNGRPDIYQYYQNELTQEIAKFLIKSYYQIKENDKNSLDNKA